MKNSVVVFLLQRIDQVIFIYSQKENTTICIEVLCVRDCYTLTMKFNQRTCKKAFMRGTRQNTCTQNTCTCSKWKAMISA